MSKKVAKHLANRYGENVSINQRTMSVDLERPLLTEGAQVHDQATSLNMARERLEEHVLRIEAEASEELRHAVKEIKERAKAKIDEAISTFEQAAAVSKSEQVEESQESSAEPTVTSDHGSKNQKTEDLSDGISEVVSSIEALLPSEQEIENMDRNTLGERARSISKMVRSLHESGALPDNPEERKTLSNIVRRLSYSWQEMLQRAEEGDRGYFLPHTLKEIDLALFTDANQILIGGKHVPLLSNLVQRLQELSRQELEKGPLQRITPEEIGSNREKAYWLESDNENFVPTADKALDGTFKDIVPGNGGYCLRGRSGSFALKPTDARFYKYVPAN